MLDRERLEQELATIVEQTQRLAPLNAKAALVRAARTIWLGRNEDTGAFYLMATVPITNDFGVPMVHMVSEIGM